MINEKKQQRTSTTRCSECRQKALILVDCHCGKYTCLNCRYPEKHECTYDFKKEGKKELEKNNPVVTGEKISKI